MKSVLAILVTVLLTGCATHNCKTLANRRVAEDYAHNRVPAGVYVVHLQNHPGEAHAVNWFTFDQNEYLWDEAFQVERTMADFKKIIHKYDGPVVSGDPTKLARQKFGMK